MFTRIKAINSVYFFILIKSSLLFDYSKVAGGIIILLDSSNVDIHSTGEYIYDILTNDLLLKSKPKLLFACNKSDNIISKSVEDIQTLIEKELSAVKETRTSLETVGEENEDQVILGTPGEDFKFDIDCPFDYSFISCSVTEDKLDDVKKFIYDVIEKK